MAYLYRHIRLDRNEPFYIGIGSDDDYSFKRAYDKKSRNRYWSSIVAKTEYEVDILMTDMSWEEACKKEIEFIKFYGRKSINEGTLVNMTDGGDGMLGIKPSEHVIKMLIERRRQEILQYDIKGNYIKEWESASEIERKLKISESQIIANCKGHKGKKSAGGYIWRYKDPEKWFDITYINNKNSHCHSQKHQKSVMQYDLDENFIDEYRSVRFAENQTNISRSTIISVCKGRQKSAGGYIWKYKNN
jgi:hypothetical protein